MIISPQTTARAAEWRSSVYAALIPAEHVGDAPWNDWEACSEEAKVIEVGLPENHIFIH